MEDCILIDERVRTNKKLNMKYEIRERIGEGCFGKIYKAINMSSKQEVALKIEMIEHSNNHRSNLIIEMSILDKLKGVRGIPKMYSSGKWQYGYYI